MPSAPFLPSSQAAFGVQIKFQQAMPAFSPGSGKTYFTSSTEEFIEHIFNLLFRVIYNKARIPCHLDSHGLHFQSYTLTSFAALVVSRVTTTKAKTDKGQTLLLRITS